MQPLSIKPDLLSCILARTCFLNTTKGSPQRERSVTPLITTERKKLRKGGARWKFCSKPLKEINPGVAQAFFFLTLKLIKVLFPYL